MPHLDAAGESFAKPRVVWDSFSDPTHIRRLAEACGLSIDVFDRELDPAHRQEYAKAAADLMRTGEPPRIAVLDPDTGLGARPAHVAPEGIQTVWSALDPRDVLVLYQHAHRRKTWQTQRSCLLSKASSGVPVATITGKAVAGDMAIPWCGKR